jgi:hypothetical protein
MTRLLGLIPFWGWLLVAAAIAAAFGGLSMALVNERAAHKTTIANHALEVAASTALALKQSENNRKLEGDLREAQAINTALVQSLEDALDGARGAADRSAVGLRNATAAAAARARSGCKAATPVGEGPAAGDPIGVLADVLGRADARAQFLGDLADRRGIAGAACELEYDAVYRALTSPTTGAQP